MAGILFSLSRSARTAGTRTRCSTGSAPHSSIPKLFDKKQRNFVLQKYVPLRKWQEFCFLSLEVPEQREPELAVVLGPLHTPRFLNYSTRNNVILCCRNMCRLGNGRNSVFSLSKYQNSGNQNSL